MRVFDVVYNDIIRFFKKFIDAVSPAIEDIAYGFLAVILYLTFPIWVIPYKIARKRKKPKPEETLSPETKQAILDGFMKGADK